MTEEKKTKPSAGTKVTFKVAAYVSGMEANLAFEGVSFFRPIPPEIKGDIQALNKLRQGLMADICGQYGVKPLGAVSAPSGGTKTLEKYLLGLITMKEIESGKSAKDVAVSLGTDKNVDILRRAFKASTGREATAEQVKEVLAKVV